MAKLSINICEKTDKIILKKELTDNLKRDILYSSKRNKQTRQRFNGIVIRIPKISNLEFIYRSLCRGLIQWINSSQMEPKEEIYMKGRDP